MTEANKKSLDAKAYINYIVNDAREQFRKAPDEEAKKQLVETFREKTASDKYRENLGIVMGDNDVIYEYAKRKKGGDLNDEELKAARTEFYGRDMNLELGEDFEKLDFGKKVDYVFDRFGDTDYAADLITDILDPRKYHSKITDDAALRNFERQYKTAVLRNILGDSRYDFDWSEDIIDRHFYDKFGRGDVALAIIKFLLERFNGKNWDPRIYGKVWSEAKYHMYNVSQKTIKRYLTSKYEGTRGLGKILAKYSAIDGSISDREIIDLYIEENYSVKEKPPFKKVNKKLHKYLVDGLIEKGGWAEFFEHDKEDGRIKLLDGIDFGDGTDVTEYIINYMFRKYSHGVEIAFLNFINTILLMPEGHDRIVDLLYENVGRISGLKEAVESITSPSLSELEKARILGNTEEEDRLNQGKFESDLAKLQELGAKLGKQIIIKDIKEEVSDETEDESEEQVDVEESKSKKRKWFF